MKTKNSLLFRVPILLLLVFVLSKSLHSGKTSTLNLGKIKTLLSEKIGLCLKKSLYKNVSAGIQIRLIKDGTILYQLNPDKFFIPASAIKIFTSAVSLIYFGADFQFNTLIKSDGEIRDTILEGNIFIKGQGDPSLQNSHLNWAAQQLKKSGINRIRGDIIYDVSFLDEEGTRFPPNARHLYSPPCAITVNYNCLDLQLEEGTTPILKTNPITDYAKLKYNISISNSFRPGLPKMTYKKETWGDSYFIEGKVTRWDKRYKVLRLCVSRPGLLAATLFKEALGKSGIGIDGAIKKGIAPITSKTLLVIKASDLKTICRFLNTESNNVAAELINKDLGATFHSTPGTRQKGLSIIKKFLIERVGLTKDTFQIKDASGLSVKNRFTASQFCQALNTFYSELREVFMETLVPQGYHPHAAYPIPPKEIKIMVKSGTLPSTGVNSVGGYIFLTRFQKALSFVIFTQRIRGSQKAYSGTYTNPLLSSLVNALKELN